MFLSKSKCWYSNICFTFLKPAVPLQLREKRLIERTSYMAGVHYDNTLMTLLIITILIILNKGEIAYD
jgi:hypothetical protein